MKIMSLLLSAAGAALAIVISQAAPAHRQAALNPNHFRVAEIDWSRAAAGNRTNDTTWGFHAAIQPLADYNWDRSGGQLATTPGGSHGKKGGQSHDAYWI